LLLPGADLEAIGAAFEAFLRHGSFWLPGESSVFGWKRFRAGSSAHGPKFLFDLGDYLRRNAPGEAAAERLFSTFAWIWNQYRIRAADDLIRAGMIIKHALLHHLKMILAIVSELPDD
jgi:hypothetical protein